MNAVIILPSWSINRGSINSGAKLHVCFNILKTICQHSNRPMPEIWHWALSWILLKTVFRENGMSIRQKSMHGVWNSGPPIQIFKHFYRKWLLIIANWCAAQNFCSSGYNISCTPIYEGECPGSRWTKKLLFWIFFTLAIFFCSLSGSWCFVIFKVLISTLNIAILRYKAQAYRELGR